MKLTRERRGDAWVLTPHTNLKGGHETDELRQAIDQIVAGDVPKIVVDLGEISWMNSCGVGTLAAAHVSCVKRGGWFRIARIDRRIHSILLITRLIRVLETFDTVEKALAGASLEHAS